MRCNAMEEERRGAREKKECIHVERRPRRSNNVRKFHSRNFFGRISGARYVSGFCQAERASASNLKDCVRFQVTCHCGNTACTIVET